MTSRNRDRDRDRDRAAAEALVRRRSVSGDTRLTLSTRAGHAAAAATVAASPTATVRTVTQERLGPAEAVQAEIACGLPRLASS